MAETNAQNTADKALMQISAHEQLCSERYANINRQLGEVKASQDKSATDTRHSIDKIYAALDGLKATAYKASGIDIALRYACIFIGAAGAIYGMIK